MTPETRPSALRASELMSAADNALLERASQLIDSRFAAGRHEVACAAQLASGASVSGLHVEASQGRASVCAEGAAISAACQRGEPITALVSVLRRADGTLLLIEPCGVCAELLADTFPDARIWAATGSTPTAVTAQELLPFRHTRRR